MRLPGEGATKATGWLGAATMGPPPLPPPPTASLSAASVNKIDKEVDWVGGQWCADEEVVVAMATSGQSSTAGGQASLLDMAGAEPPEGIRSHSRAPHASRGHMRNDQGEMVPSLLPPGLDPATGLASWIVSRGAIRAIGPSSGRTS